MIEDSPRYYSKILFFLILFYVTACSFTNPRELLTSQDNEIPLAPLESFIPQTLITDYQICPENFLEIEVFQAHEIPQYNFVNDIYASGNFPLEIYGISNDSGLGTSGEIPVSGGGWAGICKFDTSGSLTYQLVGCLIPGPGVIPNLLIQGYSTITLSTHPPCGDFGIMPLEETVHIVIPYQDGSIAEWDWENRSTGVYGKAKWVLHLPCR